MYAVVSFLDVLEKAATKLTEQSVKKSFDFRVHAVPSKSSKADFKLALTYNIENSF